MHLDKNQLEFLKSLPEKGSVPIEDISEQQMGIVSFLEKEGLIKTERAVIAMRFDPESHAYTNTYGWIKSISISEKGKAYLEEICHEEEKSKREEKKKADFIQYIEKIAKSAETQSDVALKTSKKADVKGWIAVIISILSFAWSIISEFILK